MVFTSPIDLIQRAAIYYDHSMTLQKASKIAWKTGFQSGANWMALTISKLRKKQIHLTQIDFNRLGLLKYGICSLGSILCIFLTIRIYWLFCFMIVPCFYLLESLLVFLFPLAIDGFPSIFKRSIVATQLAGGSISVSLTVLPLALFMLFGGLFGKGFIRSWAIGCLAVVIWYEDLHIRSRLEYV